MTRWGLLLPGLLSLLAAGAVLAQPARDAGPPPGSTLRSIARATGRTVRVTVPLARLRDGKLRAAVREQVGGVELELPWSKVEARRGVYDLNAPFEEARKAADEGLAVHARLVTDAANRPRWARALSGRERFDEHIHLVKAAVVRMGPSVASWSVYELRLSEEPPPPLALAAVFTTAREMNREARTFIDVVTYPFDGPRWRALPDVLEAARREGAPIDGIVIRLKAGSGLPPDELRAGIVRLTAIGLDAHLAETALAKPVRNASTVDPFLADAELCFAMEGCMAIVLGAPPFDVAGRRTDDYERFLYALRPR